MIYQVTPATGLGTPPTNPKKSVLKVTAGLVYKVEIRIPPGQKGYTGIAVFRGGHPVWPSVNNEWFSGDDERISFDDTYLIDAEPYQFDVFTYNNSTSYPHTIFFRIGLVSAEAYIARFLPSVAYSIYQEKIEQTLEKDKEKDEADRNKRLAEVLKQPLFSGGE